MVINNDMALDVAFGNSRKTKVWKNRAVLWSELLDKLSAVTRTPETVAEYKAMTRNQQSEIKDVGGFVGGYANNGSRSDIRHRSILCLDADYATGDLWADWAVQYGNASAIYSTHKHTQEKPRLRLVIPLARIVSPDEYQAIGRRIAADLGIDQFDDTSYQPQRVMFWPSCSADGDFFFDHIDAELLEPDDVLGRYTDWTDCSAWPMSSRVAEIARKTADKQQDPTEKHGIVGAFCRAYPIRDAIETFIPTYTPCVDSGRYTYTEGSTSAGVVIYDEKFSYSNHSTDPASGQLCNAWDLVRLHKFLDLDENCKPETPIINRPSYKAMTGLASEDPKVREQLVTDRIAEAAEDFAEEPDDPNAWKRRLKVTGKGGLAQTIENVVLILQNDPQLAGTLALNEMDHAIVARGPLPWERPKASRQWTDADDASLRYYLEKKYGLSGKDRIFDAVNVVAGQHRFHPVREYLDGVSWDGVTRVETLLIDYLGAEDTSYTRAVTRKTLAGAVARIYRPGCKFDYMLTIRGRQGIGKSALIAKLGGEWFSDSFSTLQGKEAYEQVMGVWIMEVGELAGMRKAEAETIKLYISKQSDRFRPAYGRRLQEFPRQCIFIGTTNETQFLRDTTGNRRFWVVDTPNEPVRDLWAELTPEIIGQIWAEAVEIYNNGENLFLPRDLEKTAREIQAEYEEENPKTGIITTYLERRIPKNWDELDVYSRRQWLESTDENSEEETRERGEVCSYEIYVEALGGNPDKMDRYASKEIRDIMDSLPEWERAKNRAYFPGYGSQRYYIRREKKG